MSIKYAYPFLTKEELSAYLGLGKLSTNDQVIIEEQLIPKVSAAIEGYCGRLLYKRSFDEKYDGPGSNIFQLNNYPIVAGSTLTITDRRSAATFGNTAYTGTYTADTDYVIDYASGQLMKAYGVWPKIFRYFRVQYVAGYDFESKTPEPETVTLKGAASKWAAIEWDKIQGHVHAADQVVRGDEVVTLKSDSIPREVAGMIDHLRRLR